MKNRGTQKGFTLVEIMIVVAMIGILLGVAATTLLRALPDYRLRSAARDMLFDLQRARLEAVKRNRNVVVEFDPESYDAGGERGGYIVCVDDPDPDPGPGVVGACDVEDRMLLGQVKEDATRTPKRMPKNVSLTDAPPMVAFDFRGLPSMAGSVRLINNKGRARLVDISAVGRISVRD